MARKKKVGEIAYESEIFQRLKQSLESAETNGNASLFTKLVNALVERRIVSRTGKIAANRESCLEYLGNVIPVMTFRDFAVLDTEPELFVHKYLFSPSERKTSLASYLQSEDVLDDSFQFKSDLGWRSESSELFEEFWDQYEMSPFEIIDRDVAVYFWGVSQ